MPIKTPDISNQDLLRKVRTSVLTDSQKKELEALLPQMTEGERKELADMIDDSVRDMIAADPELQKKIQALNMEYDKKLNALVQEQSKVVREGFEKLEREEDAVTINELEKEISETATPAPAAANHPLHHKFKHPVFKLAFAVLALAVFTGTILLGIQYL